MKSYNSISRQFSRCVEKRIIKKKKSKDVYVFSKYREILGTKRMKIRGKLRLFASRARVYVKSFLQTDTKPKVAGEAGCKGVGRG